MPLLSKKTASAIREFFPRYPERRAAVLPALHVVNEQLGYVPPEAVLELAELVGLSPAEIQDAVSFYGHFKQERPQGRYRIWVCRSVACAAREGEALLAYLGEQLGLSPGETTPDGLVTLEFAECLGACDGAPAMLVNETLYTNATSETVDALLAQITTADAAGTETEREKRKPKQ